MLLPVQQHVRDAADAAIRARFGISDVPVFAIEVPPSRALGDLAVPVAFQLARTLRKPPRAIAQELAAAIGAVRGISRIAAAPNGYLTLYLDRPAFLLARERGHVFAEEAGANTVSDKLVGEKTIV